MTLISNQIIRNNLVWGGLRFFINRFPEVGLGEDEMTTDKLWSKELSWVFWLRWAKKSLNWRFLGLDLLISPHTSDNSLQSDYAIFILFYFFYLFLDTVPLFPSKQYPRHILGRGTIANIFVAKWSWRWLVI